MQKRESPSSFSALLVLLPSSLAPECRVATDMIILGGDPKMESRYEIRELRPGRSMTSVCDAKL